MSPKRVLQIAGVLMVIAVAGFLYALHRDKTEANQSAAHPKTISGTIICLESVKNDGTQTGSCALGLRADKDTSYALNAADPTLIGSLPTGQKVRVTGTLTSPPSGYKAVNTVQIQSLSKE